jgi:formate dehydrogenase major subunit/formate dehydrogenase alpha subunit
MGVNMAYTDAGNIFHEIARVSPLHRDLTYEDMEKGDNIYPYKGEPLRDVREDIQVQRPAPGASGKLFLKLERPLFHSGTLSTRASALVNIYPHAVARMNGETAKSLSLNEGDRVRIAAKAGSIELPVSLDSDVDDSVIQLSNNFEGTGAFRITECILDPVTKAPCLEGMEITAEKVTA